jgi:hypothetical protein
MVTKPEAQALEPVLRRLSVGIKTAALYGTRHPMTRQAAGRLLEVLRPYLDANGTLAARVVKHGLIVDGVAFERGANKDLAFYLYTRKVSHMKISPGVREQELTAFLSVAGMDRAGLEAGGGIEYLLWQAEVANIQVAETALDRQEVLDTHGLNVAFALLGRGRLSPQEREIVVEILQAGPDEIKGFLEGLHSAIDEVYEEADQQEHVQQVYQAVKSLDRIILDEPIEDQPRLYVNLSEALVRIDESFRPMLTRRLFSAGEQDVARVIVSHLAGERLAELVAGSLSPGDAGDQVAGFLQVLFDDRQKANAILSILEMRLRQPGKGPTWLSDAVWPQLQSSVPRVEPLPLAVLGFDDIQIPAGHREADRRLEEARAIDDATVTREVVATLVDIFRYEDDEEAQEDTAAALERHLPWVVAHQEFALLAGILQGIRQIASGPDGTRRTLAVRILKGTAESPLLDKMLAALWAGRETAAGREIEGCLQLLDGELIRPLVQALGEEPRAAHRALLCDLLVMVGRGHVDTFGRFLNDPRWYLVRNIANVLGRLRDPRAVPELSQLVGHAEYRVRREAVDGLAGIGTEEAQARLAALLDDPDQRIRLRAVKSLDAVGARRAMPRLIALLEGRDLLNRLFPLRQAALETLERVGAREALPVLRKLARRRFVLAARTQELRRLAGRAIGVIDARSSAAHGEGQAGG